MTPLSDRQAAIMRYLRRHEGIHKYAPSYREIGDACGIGSTSVVLYNLERLQAMKLITRQPGMARSIEVTA